VRRREPVAAVPVPDDGLEDLTYPGIGDAEDWTAGPQRVLLEVRSIGKGPDGELCETMQRMVFAPEEAFGDANLLPMEVRDMVAGAKNAWDERMREGSGG
jgi:hypothetical protein